MAKPIRIKNIAAGILAAMTILTAAWVVIDKRKHSIIVNEKIDEIELDSGARIQKKVEMSGPNFPPKKLLLYADKTKRLLTVYGYDKNDKPAEITSYPFTGFSGKLGPKQKEGDLQIPEGIYDITALNPQSKFHLSIRIEYPNAFDKRMAAKENRTNLGGDIYIHGGSATIGCIPLGNDNIEELFYLVKATGLRNTDIVITPKNLAGIDLDSQTYPIAWQKQLYKNIQTFTRENLPNLSN
ncbi:MAG: L,D-transpeptidase family protein [Planctomycetes bacterium]|nr:L,D-transpeptidase family protein [Planctomycetota bacterium]